MTATAGEVAVTSRLAAPAAHRWQHERIVEPDPTGGCRIGDRLTFQSRRPLAWLPGSRRIAAAVVAAIFRHRHRQLAARFGAPAPTAGPAGDNRRS